MSYWKNLCKIGIILKHNFGFNNRNERILTDIEGSDHAILQSNFVCSSRFICSRSLAGFTAYIFSAFFFFFLISHCLVVLCRKSNSAYLLTVWQGYSSLFIPASAFLLFTFTFTSISKVTASRLW